MNTSFLEFLPRDFPEQEFGNLRFTATADK